MAVHDPAGIGVLRIDHVGLAVADLDAAIALHTRMFGLRCVHLEVNEEQGVREAMLAVGPADPEAQGHSRAPVHSGAQVQLLAPLRPDSPVGKFLDRHGPGMQQLAYTVADIDLACRRLREQGVRLLYDEPRRGTGGSLINFVHPKDAGGVLVELVQPA